ncbi:hypothetical protein N7540_012653 [Penicillium herquei]|nr:hypothetical protein N7540_012653 [Penicillium herquei]
MSAPVVIIGTREELAAAAVVHLQPEWDVIHVVDNVDSAVAEIPALLSGASVPPSALGSKNYSNGVSAVIVAGPFSDADFEAVRAASASVSAVPWLKFDISKPAPPITPEGGAEVMGRLKGGLAAAAPGVDAVILY